MPSKVTSVQGTVKVTTTCRLAGTVRVGKGNYLPVVFTAQWDRVCRNGRISRGAIPSDKRKGDMPCGIKIELEYGTITSNVHICCSMVSKK